MAGRNRHREAYPSEYVAWANMKQRCLRKTHKSYHRYGGRGITVCKRWMKFENFIADVGRKPSLEMTLERVRNKEGYRPGNCVWATRQTQQNNMCRNRLVTVNGVTHSVAEWARITKLSTGALAGRLFRGCPEGQLLAPLSTTPTHTFNGQTKSLKEWCRQFYIKPGRVRGRLHRKWSFERALTTPIL